MSENPMLELFCRQMMDKWSKMPGEHHEKLMHIIVRWMAMQDRVIPPRHASPPGPYEIGELATAIEKVNALPGDAAITKMLQTMMSTLIGHVHGRLLKHCPDAKGFTVAAGDGPDVVCEGNTINGEPAQPARVTQELDIDEIAGHIARIAAHAFASATSACMIYDSVKRDVLPILEFMAGKRASYAIVKNPEGGE